MDNGIFQKLEGYSTKGWMRVIKKRYPSATFDIDSNDEVYASVEGYGVVGMWFGEEECTVMCPPDPKNWSMHSFTSYMLQIGAFSYQPNIYAYQYAGQSERCGGAHIFYIGVVVERDSSYDIKRVHLTPNLDRATVTTLRSEEDMDAVKMFFYGLQEALT